MGVYERWVLPRVLHLAMRQAPLVPYRSRLIAAADGSVLELGLGSGLNLPFYSSQTTRVVGIDPSAALLTMARHAPRAAHLHVELLEGSAEAIPLASRSVDTVVSTWTLCSIPDVVRALSEAHRVLRPSGHLLFVEHGLSPDASTRTWQHRLTPLWKRMAGGCHLNRPIRQLVEDAGFHLEEVQTGYMAGPKPLTFMYEGRARVR